MDGVAAAALYAYLNRSKPEKLLYAEPYNIDRALARLSRLSGYDKVVFFDLGLNNNVIDTVANFASLLTSRGIRVEWYDHHVWNDEWIEKLKKSNVALFIDRSTCATGVVAKYAPQDRENIDEEFVEELVSGVCGGDLFRFDHWLSPWFIRLVRRHDPNAWRNRVFQVLSEGKLWIPEFTEKILERLELELRGYSNVFENTLFFNYNGVKFAVVLQNQYVENSFVASYIIARYGVDVVAITSSDGKISLRSKYYNVRELAVALGGGGHPRASGAKIRIPLSIKLKRIINKRAVLEYVAKTIMNTLSSSGKLDKLE